MSTLSLWAARAVTPDRTLERVRLRAESGRIVELTPDVEPGPDDIRFDDGTLVPGLVDLQVNGGEGGAYNGRERKDRACATDFHLRSGTTSLLATLVTAGIDDLVASLGRLAEDVDPGGPVVGIHLEGPFLAEAKAGAHLRAQLLDPDPDLVEKLIDAAQGALGMVTLAPERPGALEAIRRFREAGAVVAAGHSAASAETLMTAIEAGLSFVTHLGNASDWPSRPVDPVLGYRASEPGLVGTFLFEPRLRGSLILDGRHLHPGLVRALVELRGPKNVALVSDAMPAAGLPPGKYTLGGVQVELHAEGFATAGEGLAGSVITLSRALRNAVELAGLSLPVGVRMATSTPAAILGIGGRKGDLQVGKDADLLILSPDLSPEAVFRAGKRIPGPAKG